MPTGNLFFHERLLFLNASTLILLYFYTLIQLVGAVPKNVSIDDQNGDGLTGAIPIYAPPSAWANEKCAGCAIKPDTNQLFERTAMAATFMPDKNITFNSVDFDFNGTAIYIFFTLFYNEGQNVTVNTECNFTLDNEAPVFFNHSGDPAVPASTRRDYRTLVFSKAGLEHTPHHMRISMSDVPYHVFLSFDYAQYTIDEAVDTPTKSTTSQTSSTVPITSSHSLMLSSSPPPSSTTSSGTSRPAAGIIVGGVLGGLAVLAGFVGLLWLYCRDTGRYPRPKASDPAAPRPFVYSPMTNFGTSSLPQTRGVERSLAPSTTAGATGIPSFSTLSSTPARSTDTARSSPLPLSPISSGSNNARGPSVEHRLRDAHRRMQNLTAEIASTSSPSTVSRTRSSRTTHELVEEVKRLRQEIETLKQSQRSPLGPPPKYDE